MDGGIKAEQVCQLVVLDVRSGLGVQEAFVYGACPQPLGKVFLVGGREIVVPLLLPRGGGVGDELGMESWAS